MGEEMTDLSDTAADKLQAALNHAAPDPPCPPFAGWNEVRVGGYRTHERPVRGNQIGWTARR